MQMEHSNQVEQIKIEMQTIINNLRNDNSKMELEIQLLKTQLLSLNNSFRDLQENFKTIQLELQNKMVTDDENKNTSNDTSTNKITMATPIDIEVIVISSDHDDDDDDVETFSDNSSQNISDDDGHNADDDN